MLSPDGIANGETASAKILVVDDQPFNIALLEDQLREMGYEVLSATDGHVALEKAMTHQPDLMLLDFVMPGMDGLEVCRKMRDTFETSHIPVLMLTGLSDIDSKYKSLKSGAVDFISKPIDPVEIQYKVENIVKLKDYQKYLQGHNKVLQDIIEEKVGELREAFNDSINRLTLASEYKDNETAQHIRRCGSYAELMARILGYDEERGEIMRSASPMHDVGKIGISESIILKKGRLTEEEFNEMKSHTHIGAKILGNGKSEILKSAEKFALYHHENWDGSGYPEGLKGEQIPIEGRIMLLVDVYDALRSERPYKPSFPHEKVFDIITKGDGRTLPEHFDPEVLKAFKDNHLEFDKIFETMRQEVQVQLKSV